MEEAFGPNLFVSLEYRIPDIPQNMLTSTSLRLRADEKKIAFRWLTALLL
jgi:hypothetical protein